MYDNIIENSIFHDILKSIIKTKYKDVINNLNKYSKYKLYNNFFNKYDMIFTQSEYKCDLKCNRHGYVDVFWNIGNNNISKFKYYHEIKTSSYDIEYDILYKYYSHKNLSSSEFIIIWGWNKYNIEQNILSSEKFKKYLNDGNIKIYPIEYIMDIVIENLKNCGFISNYTKNDFKLNMENLYNIENYINYDINYIYKKILIPKNYNKYNYYKNDNINICNNKSALDVLLDGF